MIELTRTVTERHGPVSVLMNNAGVGSGGDVFADPPAWDEVLGVKLLGRLNGVQAFVPAMIDGDAPALVVNTGSKQGITQHPCNTAYNVSKAGVRHWPKDLPIPFASTPATGSARTCSSRLYVDRHDRAPPIRET
jgi:NADP-dependent 3-hydroxy acid dehydrogenase YdfG